MKTIFKLFIFTFLLLACEGNNDTSTQEASIFPSNKSAVSTKNAELYPVSNIAINGNSILFENGGIYSVTGGFVVQSSGKLGFSTQTAGGISIGDGIGFDETHIYEYTNFFGKINISDDARPPQEGDIRFNSITKKHQGYDGVDWNDLY